MAFSRLKPLLRPPGVTVGAASAAILALPLPAAAHGFGRLYTLPVPLWLYAWGAAAVLFASFVLLGIFATGRVSEAAHKAADADLTWRRPEFVLNGLRGLALLGLLLSIATALWGNPDPYRNFSMIAFWVIFVLGLPYFTAISGNVYALVNPWRSLARGLGRFWPGYLAGRVAYPLGLGDWPALGLYLSFIGYELFAAGRPGSLGGVLLVYTVINLLAVGLIGERAWFRHGEFFGVFLRLIGRMAPLGAGPQRRVRLRRPLSGLVDTRPAGFATVVFAIAMLSTTAFDGLRATQWWVSRFWADPYGIVTALAGIRPMQAIAALRPWYIAWESLSLIALLGLFVAAYLLALALARRLAGSRRPRRELALDFGYSLLPIALAYHLAHYATLLLNDGLKIFSAVSDPFGWGWNLFGTAWRFRAPILPDVSLIWHAQVGVILLGHIASVWVAHRIALRVFDSPRRAWLSQLPMLALMVAYTVAGLWILSQPLTVERMT